jgi:hypothetical protein
VQLHTCWNEAGLPPAAATVWFLHAQDCLLDPVLHWTGGIN